ncbi:hypothetical protein MKK84_06900 [Methylobacterium sp. E-065]|uniref:hypothetical protein n=1 Tax=Methylobacterium sp. E-065 TaxID=2836583 RepID=UPI001FBA3460|nr:hypothetical protein [Methylobacterium sp. E-065]MCJ2017151.1 hypothetical protein [Methylobacterium sp. E-065]
MRQGGLRDAILHSAGANFDHGLRRTNADKRRAVWILLEEELVSINPETGDPWSNREIARRCAVDEGLVRKLRPASADNPQIDQPRTVSRGGKVYSMETGRIGRQQPEPDAAAVPRVADPAPEPEQGPGNVVVLGSRLTIMLLPGAVAAFGVVGFREVRPVVVTAALRPYVGIRLGAARRMRATAASRRIGLLHLTDRPAWRHGPEGFACRVYIRAHVGLP